VEPNNPSIFSTAFTHSLYPQPLPTAFTHRLFHSLYPTGFGSTFLKGGKGGKRWKKKLRYFFEILSIGI